MSFFATSLPSSAAPSADGLEQNQGQPQPLAPPLSAGEQRRQRAQARRDAARQQRYERREAMRGGVPTRLPWNHPRNTSAAQSVQQVAPEYRSMPNQPDLKPWSFQPRSMAGRPAAYGPSPTAAARYNEMARRMQAPGMAVQEMKNAQAANQAAAAGAGAVQKIGDARYMSGSHGYGYSVPGTPENKVEGPHVFDNGRAVDSQASRAAGRIVHMPGTETQKPDEISAMIRDRIPAAVKDQSAAAAVAKAGGVAAESGAESPMAASARPADPRAFAGRMASGARKVGRGIAPKTW